MCRVVVLIGGNGSNLQALIDKQHPDSAYHIAGVISHRQEAYGLERAKRAHLPTAVVAHRDFTERAGFEAALLETLAHYRPDLIVLAGFMRILSPAFIEHYPYQILNIHPALLPDYKGLDTHQRALADKAPLHGASVHFVTAALDDGPIVAHMTVPVLNEDTIESLTQRVHLAEHCLYPTVVEWFAKGRLQYNEQGILFDQQPLPPRGLEVRKSS